jgi:hypothetical protein
MVAIIPDAIVIATMELPTEALTRIAMKNAIRISGSPLFSRAGPIIFPSPESCSIQRITPPLAITRRIIPTGLRE